MRELLAVTVTQRCAVRRQAHVLEGQRPASLLRGGPRLLPANACPLLLAACCLLPAAIDAGKPPVLSVDPHVPALLAYAQLAAQQVSGAPVVTASGEMIANLSISDLR